MAFSQIVKSFLGADANSWICPPAGSSQDEILGWVQTMVRNYQLILSNSDNYRRLHNAIRVLSETPADQEINDKQHERLSKLNFNRTKREMTEMVAILSDLKQTGKYVAENNANDQQAAVLTKLYKALWLHPYTAIRSKLIQLFQYALTGEGYLMIEWSSDPFYKRSGSLNFIPLSIDDVAFTQLGKDKDIQKAYAVAIRHELPIAQACMLYPEFASKFHPNNTTPSWFRQVKSGVAKMFFSEALNISYENATNLSGQGFPHSQAPVTSEATIDIYEIYVLDFSINTTGHEVSMGANGTGEFYTVPSYGQMIPTKLNDLAGKPIMRPATREEAMLYPRRRRIICTNSVIISDGPSPWAHGLVPLARFTLSDWCWDRVGNSVAMDGYSLNKTIENSLKGFHDQLERQFQPGLKMPNSLSNATIASYDPRRPGTHIKVDPYANTTIAPVVPPEMNVIQSTALEYVELLHREADYIIGKPETRALAEAQQIPSAETFERILQMNGPMTKYIAMNVEEGLLRIAEMAKALMIQFCHSAKRFQILGKDGLTYEDWDYDPGTMTPAPIDPDKSNTPFPTTHMARVEQHQKGFFYQIVPGSSYNVVDVQRQMLLLQLWRDPKNYPMDPWTLAEIVGLNIGPPPEGANSMVERWEAWQQKSAQVGISIQQMATIAQAALQGQLQQAQMEQALMAMQAGLGGGAGSQNGAGTPEGSVIPAGRQPGRPPSGQAPPALLSRSDGNGGQRTTITESKH